MRTETILYIIANTIQEFPDKQPVLTAVVGVGVGLTFAAITGKAIGTKVKTNHSGHTSQGSLLSQTMQTVVDTVVDAVSKGLLHKQQEAFIIAQFEPFPAHLTKIKRCV